MFSHRIFVSLSLLVAAWIGIASPAIAADQWKAGVGREVITPDELMWLSGYAARNRPAEGKAHDLWAKALALEDAQGNRVVLVTLDLVGIDRELAQDVCTAVQNKHGLKRSQIALNVSHTHSGPVVGENLQVMYFFDDEQQKLVRDYTASLKEKIAKVVNEAIGNLSPAELTWGHGQATFAVNRRNNAEGDVQRLRAEGKLKGPVDHDVPVLAVKNQQGELLAIMFAYACHATVLDAYQISGDYPGYAQIELEKKHPGATAMFVAGCGADQNPVPRRKTEYAEDYGRQLAAAVDEVLSSNMTAINAPLRYDFAEIDLPFQTLPTREQLQKDRESDNKYVASRAKLLLAQIDAGQPLSPTYPYPIQVWRFGNDLTWAMLGGEVVVDYALRLKEELGDGRKLIAGYTNDVMAYIPSRRVLGEGGYEGAGAMVYYGQPTSWAPEVEELIINEVLRQANAK